MTRKLAVHIGIGKAGSTAIQTYLLRNRDKLKEARIHYWGLNLEHAHGQNPYSWQAPAGIGILKRMKADEAKKQLKHALLHAVDGLGDNDQAIWSNESIYERPDVYGPALADLSAETGINLTIVAYARSHWQYIISAYKQWGIKHKTNPGRILGFHQWVNTRKDFLAYGKRLSLWDSRFDKELRLFNYDSAGDIVAHFLGILSLQSKLPQTNPSRSINSSPRDSELALFALYNNQFDDPATPKDMQGIMNRYQQAGLQNPLSNLSSLFPSTSDITEAIRLFDEDIAVVDELLNRHGEPPLPIGEMIRQDEGLNEAQATTCAMSALLSMLVAQDQRIAELEKRISSLQAS